MPNLIGSDLEFVGGARIGGLPPAIAPGQAATFEQLGGGGSAPIESAIVSLPAQQQNLETTIVRLGTLPTQSIRAWLGSTADNEIALLEGVSVMAECQTNAITIVLDCRYFESGDIKINYQVI
jgi:hypothetical protein